MIIQRHGDNMSGDTSNWNTGKYRVSVFYANSDIGTWRKFKTEHESIQYKLSILDNVRCDVEITTYENNTVIDHTGITNGEHWTDCFGLEKYFSYEPHAYHKKNGD